MSLKHADLPTTIPVFPLSGAVVFPRAQLPLHIFEPRYLAMVKDVLAGERTIGMVQPRDDTAGQLEPPVYHVGCAGRLTSFQELDNGRNLVTLTGLCRFEIEDELDRMTPYRLFQVRYDNYAQDMATGGDDGIDRDALLEAVRKYIENQELQSDWESIEKADNETLINALSMLTPFLPKEKQALVEARDLASRAAILMTLLEMAGAQAPGSGSAVQ